MAVVSRTYLLLCLIPPILYFGITFPILMLSGLSPDSHFYNLSSTSWRLAVADLAVNALFCGIFIYFFRRYIPRQVNFPRVDHWMGIIAAIGAILLFAGSNWDLSREVIKSSASLMRSIAISGASAYLGAVVMTTARPRRLVVASGALVASIVLSWERDQILYLLFPLLLRLGQLRFRPLLTVSSAALGAVLLLSYKFIVTQAKSYGGFQTSQFFSAEFWQYALRSFTLDNLHKSMLEISYMSGEHPPYNLVSYFRPCRSSASSIPQP